MNCSQSDLMVEPPKLEKYASTGHHLFKVKPVKFIQQSNLASDDPVQQKGAQTKTSLCLLDRGYPHHHQHKRPTFPTASAIPVPADLLCTSERTACGAKDTATVIAVTAETLSSRGSLFLAQTGSNLTIVQ